MDLIEFRKKYTGRIKFIKGVFSPSVKKRLVLEDKIMRFMGKVELLQGENPKLAYRFLNQATRLYHEKLGGYSFEIDQEFSRIFNGFFDKYPTTIRVNSKLR
jgi:hypothetical protein